LQQHPALVEKLRAAGFDPERYPAGVPLSPVLYAAYEKAAAQRAKPAKEPDYDLSEPKPQDRPGQALRALIDDFKARFVRWRPQVDLLGSGPDDRDFVVEIDNDGCGWLRFGDDECGQRPEAGATFFAAYRVGNGRRGNVGGEAIQHVVFRHHSDPGADLAIRNPLPARGGVDPEPVAEAKLFAPSAFRKVLKRAITGDDYAQLAQRECKTKVQRAAAILAWTGSWYEASVAIDPKDSEEAPRSLLRQIDHTLQRYRRIGHDLTVTAAHYVPIELELTVCVLPHFLRGHVKTALLDLFSSSMRANGWRGAFHPDQLTFGDAVTLSGIVAAAQAVPGVESVRMTKLNRLFEQPNRELEKGVLPIGPLEVAQLDNDLNFPEHGKLTLIVQGGR
jgi:predicted phage baseplate assembly protein